MRIVTSRHHTSTSTTMSVLIATTPVFLWVFLWAPMVLWAPAAVAGEDDAPEPRVAIVGAAGLVHSLVGTRFQDSPTYRAVQRAFTAMSAAAGEWIEQEATPTGSSGAGLKLADATDGTQDVEAVVDIARLADHAQPVENGPLITHELRIVTRVGDAVHAARLDIDAAPDLDMNRLLRGGTVVPAPPPPLLRDALIASGTKRDRRDRRESIANARVLLYHDLELLGGTGALTVDAGPTNEVISIHNLERLAMVIAARELHQSEMRKPPSVRWLASSHRALEFEPRVTVEAHDAKKVKVPASEAIDIMRTGRPVVAHKLSMSGRVKYIQFGPLPQQQARAPEPGRRR